MDFDTQVWTLAMALMSRSGAQSLPSAIRDAAIAIRKLPTKIDLDSRLLETHEVSQHELDRLRRWKLVNVYDLEAGDVTTRIDEAG